MCVCVRIPGWAEKNLECLVKYSNLHSLSNRLAIMQRKVMVRITTDEPPTEVMTPTERQSMIEPFNLPMAVDQTHVADATTAGNDYADVRTEWTVKVKTEIYGTQTYYIRMQ